MTRADQPIRIGILTDLSGKAAYIGQQMRNGAEMAAEEINSSSQRLELIFGDHGLETTRAVSEAQKMINMDKVDAVISSFSGPTRAASAIVANGGKILLYSAAAVSVLNENKYAFKSYQDFVLGCEALANYFKKEGISAVGLMKAESEFGELCESGAKRVFPNIVATSYKIGDDVSAQALILKSKGIVAVINATLEGDMRNMLKAFNRLAFFPQIGGNRDVFTSTLVSENPKALTNTFSFGMPDPEESFCNKLFTRDPSLNTKGCDQAGMVYLHVKQLYVALESCKEKGLDCQADALMKSPADAHFGFRRWQENHQALYDESLQKMQNGKFVIAQ